MKKLSTLSLLLLMAIASRAQSPTPSFRTEWNNVLSFNTGTFIQNFIYPLTNYNNYIYTPDQYLLIYHRIFQKNNAIRLGVNLDNTHNTNKSTDTISNDNNRQFIKLGLGYERYVYISKFWNFYYGADAQYSYNKYNYFYKNSSSQNNTSLQTSNGMAVYGFIGLQLKFNKRVGASLENGVSISQSKENNSQNYNNVFSEYVQTNNAVNYINPQVSIRFLF